MRSICSSTTALGISTRRFFRVSLTSTRSVFISSVYQSESERWRVVRKGGVEPPKPFGYRILSPARLPVPPLSQASVQPRVRQTLMLPSAPEMYTRTDLYHGLFRWRSGQNGQPTVSRLESGPAVIPCPTTGRPLRVATLDAEAAAICPRCAHHGQGGL